MRVEWGGGGRERALNETLQQTIFMFAVIFYTCYGRYFTVSAFPISLVVETLMDQRHFRMNRA